ncbi:MAG: phage integrase N-terminal SAM-like domain-containing protein, partial [Limosilactobacillus fermentum]
MADHYPYQQPFENFLIQQGLAPLTVATYATSLTSFFDFLRANRPAFAHDPQVDAVTETDVRTFFNYLKDDRVATLATTNKVLSHLNRS